MPRCRRSCPVGGSGRSPRCAIGLYRSITSGALLRRDRQQSLQLRQRVGLVQWLVVADPQHAREANGDAALVARAAIDSLEAQLEHEARPDAAHGAELLERRRPDDAVDDLELRAGEAGVRLGEGDELKRAFARRLAPADGVDGGLRLGGVDRPAVPNREGVVGVDARAPAVTRLRVEKHAVDAERIDLPLPPRAGGEVVLLPAAGAIACLAVLEHQALDATGARLAAQRREVRPVGA